MDYLFSPWSCFLQITTISLVCKLSLWYLSIGNRKLSVYKPTNWSFCRGFVISHKAAKKGNLKNQVWKYHYSYPIHSFIDISYKNYQYLVFIFFTFNCICSVCPILVSVSYVVCLDSTVCHSISNELVIGI